MKNRSVALIFQIRAIDTSRMIKVIGKVDVNFQKKIDKILMEMFGL